MTDKPTYQALEQRITLLERAEEALRESKEKYKHLFEASKRAEELYRSFLDSSADAIAIYDLKGRTRYVNPAFTHLFGWALEEIEGRSIPMIPEPEEKKTRGMVRALIRRGVSYHGFETKRLTKDGRLLDVSISASRVDDHHGELSGVLVTFRDISERKGLEAQLLHAHKMEAIGTLAGGIAHDFNNILQAISGYSQILLMGKKSDDPDYMKLEAIEQSAQKASELTKQLLIFSRKVHSELRQMDLNRSVETASRLLERTIPKMIRIELRLGKGVHDIHADSVQVEQIIMNLGVNARDAMPEGGRLILKTKNTRLDETYCRAHVGAVAGDYVQMSVRDTGCGMDEQVLEHLFEPFFTTKEAGKGTGLGLAMVYGIVKNHGGYISCSSHPGEGTTFDIYFPVLHAGGEKRREKKKDDRHVSGGHESVLLVDDEQTIREVVQDMLDRFGYRTLSADSGERAIEIFKSSGEPIDLVILDLNMPGMGGHKCLEELLKIDSGVKIIIASGYSDNKKVQETLNTGAAGFICKPYKYKDILQKVREILDKAA